MIPEYQIFSSQTHLNIAHLPVRNVARNPKHSVQKLAAKTFLKQNFSEIIKYKIFL